MSQLKQDANSNTCIYVCGRCYFVDAMDSRSSTGLNHCVAGLQKDN